MIAAHLGSFIVKKILKLHEKSLMEELRRGELLKDFE